MNWMKLFSSIINAFVSSEKPVTGKWIFYILYIFHIYMFKRLHKQVHHMTEILYKWCFLQHFQWEAWSAAVLVSFKATFLHFCLEYNKHFHKTIYNKTQKHCCHWNSALPAVILHIKSLPAAQTCLFISAFNVKLLQNKERNLIPFAQNIFAKSPNNVSVCRSVW